MKKSLLILITLITLASCAKKSELKHESGTVIEKQFSPELNGSGTGLGISPNGPTIISESIHKPEQYLLIIKCEHNTLFSIDRKNLYMTLEKGDTIDIQYYEYVNGDGEVVDFDFVGATKK